VLWKDCEEETKATKRLRWHREHRWALYALLSVFIFAFLFAAIPVSAHSTIHKAKSTDSHQFTLKIYGNANEDDTIDMRDVTYIKLVIFGKKPETEFCDANYDGRVSMLDVVQTKLIIVGKEGELTIVDSANRTVTVKKPVKRIAGLHTSPCREFCMLGVEDKVVGVTKYILDDLDMYPRLAGKPNIGSVYEPYYEVIAEVDPDVLITTASITYLEPILEKLEPLGIKVVALDLCTPATYDQELKQLGYIVDKKRKSRGLHQMEA